MITGILIYLTIGVGIAWKANCNVRSYWRRYPVETTIQVLMDVILWFPLVVLTGIDNL
jgi:hypothetical protein